MGFVLADGLGAYALARAVMGLGSGGLWTAITLSTLEHRPRQEYLCMGRILSAYSAGAVLGPAIGAIGGIEPPFLVYLAIVVAAALIALLMPAAGGTRRYEVDRTSLRLGRFWFASSGIVFAVLALALAEGVFPLHLSTRLDQTGRAVASAAMGLAVATAAALAARLDPRTATVGGSVLAMGGLTLVGASGDPVRWGRRPPPDRDRHRSGRDRFHRRPPPGGAGRTHRDGDGGVVGAGDPRVPARSARPGAPSPSGWASGRWPWWPSRPRSRS
jgi:MFS family permease